MQNNKKEATHFDIVKKDKLIINLYRFPEMKTPVETTECTEKTLSDCLDKYGIDKLKPNFVSKKW